MGFFFFFLYLSLHPHFLPSLLNSLSLIFSFLPPPRSLHWHRESSEKIMCYYFLLRYSPASPFSFWLPLLYINFLTPFSAKTTSMASRALRKLWRYFPLRYSPAFTFSYFASSPKLTLTLSPLEPPSSTQTASMTSRALRKLWRYFLLRYSPAFPFSFFAPFPLLTTFSRLPPPRPHHRHREDRVSSLHWQHERGNRQQRHRCLVPRGERRDRETTATGQSGDWKVREGATFHTSSLPSSTVQLHIELLNSDGPFLHLLCTSFLIFLSFSYCYTSYSSLSFFFSLSPSYPSSVFLSSPLSVCVRTFIRWLLPSPSLPFFPHFPILFSLLHFLFVFIVLLFSHSFLSLFSFLLFPTVCFCYAFVCS